MRQVRGALLAAILGLAAGPTLHPQDDAAALAHSKAVDVRSRCITLLDGVEGVTSVNYAGSGGEYRLLISVRDYTAKEAVRRKTGGDSWEGLTILWTVTNGGFTNAANRTIAAPREPAPQDPAAFPQDPPPAARPAPPPAAAPDIPDCDIVRAQYGLPPVRHPVGNGSYKSWVPCKVWLRAVQGPAGGHSYLYTKHRPGCPFMDGLASSVYREGFLYPTELRGSDSSWQRQVAQDLDAKFPRPPPPMVPKTTPYRPDTPAPTPTK
jgi:hypothetical protein